jgi:hypothetical protein
MRQSGWGLHAFFGEEAVSDCVLAAIRMRRFLLRADRELSDSLRSELWGVNAERVDPAGEGEESEQHESVWFHDA